MNNEHIRRSLQHQQAGQLQKAEVIYRQILEDDPDHVDANRYLRILAHQVGRYGAAIELIQKAIKVDPDLAEAHCNLGMVLQELNRIDEAIACFRKATVLNPENNSARGNIALALKNPSLLKVVMRSSRLFLANLKIQKPTIS